MDLGKDFLLPEEIKLAEWIICTHDTAFAWTDDERGSFDPQYFAPIEIPHVAHIPWVYRQGPIPRGILSEVTKIIEDKWRSGVYEPSSSSYNSRWFCVYKKDGKSLCLIHSLEPLNTVTIRNFKDSKIPHGCFTGIGDSPCLGNFLLPPQSSECILQW